MLNNTPGARLTHLRKLYQKKYRDQFSQFVVENPFIIRDAYAKGIFPLEVFISERAEAIFEDLISMVKQQKKIPVRLVDHGTLQKMSSLESMQGIIAVYQKTPTKVDMRRPIVFLNGVSDPSNVGAIMRSAAAFGIGSIVCDQSTADVYNPKTISAAKESIFFLAHERLTIDFLKDIALTMPVISLEAHEGSPLTLYRPTTLFCLLLGSEAHGIDRKAQKYIKTKLTIQTDSSTVESLNVHAAAAIALHYFFSAGNTKD